MKLSELQLSNRTRTLRPQTRAKHLVVSDSQADCTENAELSYLVDQFVTNFERFSHQKEYLQVELQSCWERTG